MVHFCAVPGCSNRSDRETHLSYHRLPLKNKNVLKEWIHKIRRTNLPLKESTRVCSEHFLRSTGRMLRVDEVPSEKLPVSRYKPLRCRRRHAEPSFDTRHLSEVKWKPRWGTVI